MPVLKRNEKSAQRGSFRPDVPADIRPKTSVRPSKCWKKKKQAVCHGYAARTSTKKWGGGWKKEGVETLTNDTPPKKGCHCTPPRTVRFPPPSGVSALFFLYKYPRQSRPEALLEGSKNFRESAFSGTFSSSHTFCTPHVTAQIFMPVLKSILGRAFRNYFRKKNGGRK